MAIFNISFINTLKLEGEHSNDPDDYGKETYRGISRRYYPNWEGWDIVDKKKENGSINKLVSDFYKKTYWDVIKGDQIVSQKLANKVFDVSVCQGISRSIGYLQKGINTLNKKSENDLDVDIIIGPLTLEKCNSLREKDIEYLISLICMQQLNHYMDFATEDTSQRKFIRGWINRSLYIG